jgi:hypothetical protein
MALIDGFKLFHTGTIHQLSWPFFVPVDIALIVIWSKWNVRHGQPDQIALGDQRMAVYYATRADRADGERFNS